MGVHNPDFPLENITDIILIGCRLLINPLRDINAPPLAQIRQMDPGESTEGLGIPAENADSYFHPLPGSLSPVRVWQAIEIECQSA